MFWNKAKFIRKADKILSDFKQVTAVSFLGAAQCLTSSCLISNLDSLCQPALTRAQPSDTPLHSILDGHFVAFTGGSLGARHFSDMLFLLSYHFMQLCLSLGYYCCDETP
jgi:UDP-N-acetylglucosamine:LPS N-acetylglucosamine transferase